MCETVLEAKQSKKMFVLACCAAWLFIAFFLGICAFLVIKLCDYNSLTFDEKILCCLCLVYSLIFALVILVIFIYIYYNYKHQIDIYMADKMYRKKGNKIVFELEYKKIVLIREGFLSSIFLFCEEPIIKTNGKKGPKTLYEHYSIKDIFEIEKIISAYKNTTSN